MGHINELHISLKYKRYTIAKVLIDNRSALNMLPMVTLDQLLMDKSFMMPNHIMVKMFDRATSKVVGDINVELEIGPHIFNIPFQIMNIKPAYSILLGRPWIHLTGTVPS